MPTSFLKYTWTRLFDTAFDVAIGVTKWLKFSPLNITVPFFTDV